ncbi:MAG TPA: hypothetical protein VMD05_00810 [Candidatus Nanoarchaeia archaeon]|nr:hypothetical protein [Candidatus Nanoarchaeia archaeon]
MVRRSILDQIFKEMLNIRCRLDELENSFSNWNPQPMAVPESKLMALPDHLRQTFMVVSSKGECSATSVSNLTGRCRAIESNYLNQLSRMGWLNKRRVSKTTHFRLVASNVIERSEKMTQMSAPVQIRASRSSASLRKP